MDDDFLIIIISPLLGYEIAEYDDHDMYIQLLKELSNLSFKYHTGILNQICDEWLSYSGNIAAMQDIKHTFISSIYYVKKDDALYLKIKYPLFNKLIKVNEETLKNDYTLYTPL